MDTKAHQDPAVVYDGDGQQPVPLRDVGHPFTVGFRPDGYGVRHHDLVERCAWPREDQLPERQHADKAAPVVNDVHVGEVLQVLVQPAQ